MSVASRLSRNAHRQFGYAVHEGRVNPLRLANNLDLREAQQDLLPQNLQLHFGEALAHAAVNAEAEREMLPRPGAIDDEAIGVVDRLFVAVAGDVPHGDLVALADRLTANLGIDER